jgi:hypothetical protein
MTSELLCETEAFVELVQKQFESAGVWDMEYLESGLREALLKDGCRILEALLNQPNTLGKHVPTGQIHSCRSRNVHSLLGTFKLSRGYYTTENGRVFVMDKLLGLTGSYTPGLSKMMCRAAGTDGSYDEAAETLMIYAGVKVPASQIRKMVQKIGPDIEKWSCKREEHRCEAVPTLYVSYDGTGVPMRKDEIRGRKGKQPDGSSKGREVKLGSVFTVQNLDDDGKPVRDKDSTTYLASFSSASDFGGQLRQEARLRGLAKAERVCAIGDGARWIWNLARINFPKATQILDFYHACEHLTGLACALFPNNDTRVSSYVEKWVKWLEHDKVAKVISEAEEMLPHHGPRRKKALCEIGYFSLNAERMMYATFRKQGYFIGSGVVEAGCKAVVGKRTKQSGMFWRVKGAQNILNIRCSVLNNTYDNFWNYYRQKLIDEMGVAA